VKNGGWGLVWSEGIVSSEDDSILVYDMGQYANDYTITIKVTEKDKYLNVRWRGSDNTFVKAKMLPCREMIVLDYNGKGKVATVMLYDVRVSAGDRDGFYRDWDDAWRRGVRDMDYKK